MIIRRRHTANYTTIGNVLFEDTRLAADEVGILAYLLSRPHDWEVRRPALMRRWNMGRDAIKRVLHNLVRTGWCRPEKVRLRNGTFHMVYEIRDQPGPSLTDKEVRQALSLVSSEAVAEESIVRDAVPATRQPPTGYPSLADPSPGDPSLAYIDIQKPDSPRTEFTQRYDGESAGARVFSAGSQLLADAFLRSLGFDRPLDVPPEFAGVPWRAVMWEQAGWTVDLVEAETRRLAGDVPLKPLAYFEKVFATAFAKRNSPLPVAAAPAREQSTGT
ncbi:hypothetical protein [Bradyrhizobium sp. BR 1433]|uniref:hypothetical protein n=1 Tax=Bradyrhizobium sp. BR 1433 TaxID=3447967 RepID=UPI003EE7F319